MVLCSAKIWYTCRQVGPRTSEGHFLVEAPYWNFKFIISSLPARVSPPPAKTIWKIGP